MRLFLLFISLVMFSCNEKEAVPVDYIGDCEPDDYGIGVLVFHFDQINLDTIAIYSERNNVESKVAEWFGYDIVLSDTMSRNAFIEVFYEEGGCPVLELDAEWAKIIYYQGKEVLSGWVKTNQATLQYYSWEEILTPRAKFFMRCIIPEFYDNLDGNLIEFELDYSYDKRNEIWWPDYDFSPIKTEGNWMKLEVMSPSQYCVSDTTSHRSKILWIKYLNNDGRPNVWYYSRGC